MKKTILAAVIATTFTTSISAVANDYEHSHNREHNYKSFNFKALSESANAADWDATAPWKLPRGYTQKVVSNETDLNIYPEGRDDWHDMNVVNETGPQAGRFMYRTHEVRLGRDPVVDAIGGSVSVVTLKRVKAKLLLKT